MRAPAAWRSGGRRRRGLGCACGLQALARALLLLCLVLPLAPARAADEAWPSLQLSDAFVELHTGPGRGYPVFHVAPRGEVVQLLLASTSWIKLRTAKGVEGWVPREQLQGSLLAAGAAPDAVTRWVDTHLRQRAELGAAAGRFAGEPMLELFGRVKLADAVGLELRVGQVQGLYSGTDFWHVDATLDPFNDRALAPVFAIGVGRLHDVPNASLVEQARTNAKLANARLGLRWQFGSRFVLRGDYTLYTALLSDQKSREYRALTVGLSFLF